MHISLCAFFYSLYIIVRETSIFARICFENGPNIDNIRCDVMCNLYVKNIRVKYLINH